MSDAPGIARRSTASDDGNFDSLRAEGIRLLQEFSGEIWTDYNLHDPGITILEHLCYGLTDLIYRTSFDVEDYLTGTDGHIDFEAQALHLPHEILPCRPTTADDYRRKIIAAVESVDDVWIWPWRREGGEGGGDGTVAGGPGLYQIMVREGASASGTREGADERTRETLSETLRVFHENRNLCEDVHVLTVAEEIDYHLLADIDIVGARPAVDILQEVYEVAEAYIAGHPRPIDPVRSLRDGMTLDQIFEGPSGDTGVALLDARGFDHENIFIADIVSRLQAVEGVSRVRDLHLRPEGSVPPPGQDASGGAAGAPSTPPQPLDTVPRYARIPGDGTPRWSVPRLADPRRRPVQGEGPEAKSRFAAALETWDDRVRLWRDGRRLEEPADFPARYRKTRLDRRGRRRSYEELDSFYRAPRGEYRELAKYHSIQEHFPAIYGVNAEGVPSSAPDSVRRSAYRLKAYLLLFEQVMANFAANLDHLPELFSTKYAKATGDSFGADSTYRFQTLGEDTIPGFGQLFGSGTVTRDQRSEDDPGSAPTGPYLDDPQGHLARVIAHFDDVEDRKGRLLDHMLAAFGESLTPGSSRELEQSEGGDGSANPHVRNKARFLERIVEVTRDRAGALDYRTGDFGDATGFKRRVAFQLGIEETDVGSLTSNPSVGSAAVGAEPPGREGFHVLEHILLRPADGAAEKHMWDDFYACRMSVFFPNWVGRSRRPSFRHQAEEAVRVSCPAHVHAQCFWLDPEEMVTLEGLANAWLKERRRKLQGLLDLGRRGTEGPTPSVDDPAAKLVSFVMETQTSHGI